MPGRHRTRRRGQHASVQRLQFFLSESTWDHEQVNARRLELLLTDPATAPHPGGVLVIDDSGDRKNGKATAHIGRQWLGRLGKTDNGIVTVTTCWADENLYCPLHAVPYSPAHHFPKGKSDPGFRTKLQIAAELARTAKAAGVAFRAVAADCAYGDQDGFRRQLDATGPPPSGLSATDTPRPGGPPTRPLAGGDPTETSAWSWPPPTRPPFPRKPPGTWPPTCPAPADPARPTVPNRPPT
ncbi:transposase [Streptomyces sp. NPDC056921]|uniref:IS701 family transposase n=1 Tax=Streptomyces sp. NPDC056921 TaxID=3345966 RepID=UPI003635D38C